MENNEKKNYRKIGVGMGLLYFFLSVIFVTAVIYVSYVAITTESATLTYMAAFLGVLYCIIIFALEFTRISKAKRKELAAKKEEK